MKSFLMILTALLLVGCANPYADFYTPATKVPRESLVKVAVVEVEKVKSLQVSGDALKENGFILLGSSDFRGNATFDQLESHAKRIRASRVIYTAEYLGTATHFMPLTRIDGGQTYTTTFQGNAGGQPFFGSAQTTTPIQYHTDFIPYQASIYEHHAWFWGTLR